MRRKNVVVTLCGGPLFEEESFWRTRARLIRAVDLAKEANCDLLVSSGVSGQVLRTRRPSEPEAWSYAKHAVDRLGMPPGRVFVEDLSRDTVGNVLFSRQFLRDRFTKRNDCEVVWVTNRFHGRRLGAILNQFAMDSDPWKDILELVEDTSDIGELGVLHQSEKASLTRFRKDFGAEDGAEVGLTRLLGKHDFYRAYSYVESGL